MLQLPEGLNWIAVGVAGAAYWVLGAIWYSKFAWGKTWMELIGKTEEQLKEDFNPISYVGMFVLAVFTCAILAAIIGWSGATDMIEGVSLALLIALGFTVPLDAGHVFFQGRPWALMVIDTGYHVCGAVIAALIIMAF